MTATDTARDLVIHAARAAADKKAHDLVALDVSEHIYLTDVFLLAAARNERQVDAIVDSVDEALARRGVQTLRREGQAQRRWVLLDYGDLVVHVQHEEERAFYALDRLWRDCPLIELPADVREAAVANAAADGADDESPRYVPAPMRETADARE